VKSKSGDIYPCIVLNKYFLIINNLCYTLKMQEQSFWLTWLRSLQRWGLVEPASALLEAAGPLSLLLAQFIYLGQPFLGRSGAAAQIDELGRVLENSDHRYAFIQFLRQEGQG
jgi:hypothetical protein